MSARNEYSVFLDDVKRHRVLRGLFDDFYADCTAEVIFDTSRAWCAWMPWEVSTGKVLSDQRAHRVSEYRYTKSFVYPALGAGARSVLRPAARELLRTPGFEKIVQVELDPAVIELARSTMRSANAGSLENPRVQIVTGDAMSWLRAARSPSFDAVIVDLPDPDTPVLGRLYSTEFYTLVSRALVPDGLMVVQSGSPYSTPTAFWRTVSTVKSAGYAVTPYHVYVPSFGDWGFTLEHPRVVEDMRHGYD